MSATKPAARAASAAPAARKRAAARDLGPRHEDKRTAILRTAAQLFAAQGYEATSLDAIAERMGIHKATLYHYVEGKESILYQCLVLSFSDLDAVIARMADRGVPVRARLLDFAQSLAQAQNNDFGRCLVLVGARPLAQLPGGEIRRFLKRLDDTVRALVVEGIADGSIAPRHPGLVSAMFFGAMNWVPQWFSAEGKLTLAEVVDEFMQMLWGGIAARPR